jgi:hypothetical protein
LPDRHRSYDLDALRKWLRRKMITALAADEQSLQTVLDWANRRAASSTARAAGSRSNTTTDR